jgi:hypothetical protein
MPHLRGVQRCCGLVQDDKLRLGIQGLGDFQILHYGPGVNVHPKLAKQLPRPGDHGALFQGAGFVDQIFSQKKILKHQEAGKKIRLV